MSRLAASVPTSAIGHREGFGHADRVKGSIQWYVAGTSGDIVVEVLGCCDEAQLSLAHPRTGVVTYLDDATGKEGDQIATTREGLATTIEHKLKAGQELVVQLWLDIDTDVLATIRRVPEWDSTLFSFDFDGLTIEETVAVETTLFESRQRLDRPTTLWLAEHVGIADEYGPAHEWNGRQAPAWRATY
jgi:hypothetical protein